MSELPEYLRQPLDRNWSFAINSELRLRLRRELILIMMKIEDHASSAKIVRLTDDLLSYYGGHLVQSDADRTILDRRHLLYEATASGKLKDRYGKRPQLLSPKIVREFIEGNVYEDRQTDTNKGAVAVIRDYLVWLGRLKSDDLMRPTGDLDDAYRLFEAFQPSGKSLFGDDCDGPERAFVFHGLERRGRAKALSRLLLRRLKPAIYEVELRQLDACGRIRVEDGAFFAESSDSKCYRGWLFLSELASLGHVIRSDHNGQNLSLRLRTGANAGECLVDIAESIIEASPSLKMSDGYTFEFKIVENIDQFMYNRNGRIIPGGRRFLNDLDKENVLSDFSDRNFGQELVDLLYEGAMKDGPWVNSPERLERMERRYDRIVELIKGGVPLDVPDNRGWYPIHYFTASAMTDLLDRIFERNDVDYLLQTPDGRFVTQMVPVDAIDIFTLERAHTLYQKARAQAAERGVSEEQLTTYAPPPAAAPGGMG